MTGSKAASGLPRPACPKRMTYGPCGGVAPDGECEVPGNPCVFLGLPLPRWVPGRELPRPGDQVPARTVPRVIADLPAAPLDLGSLERSAGELAGSVDAVLLGDHGGQRVQFPPSLRAQFVQRAGVAAWAGLNCRDRNRVALEGELAGLAAVGVAGVHCVTGDHTSLGHRPDARGVFDVDSTQLVELARSQALVTSVAENPVAPPIDRRAARLAQKALAGAQICFVNHTRGPQAVARFIESVLAECAPLGVRIDFVACVAVVCDEASAAVLRSFPGLELPPGYLSRILAATDVEAAGIELATQLARELLEIPGVAGVNLSGGARPGDELRVARVMAQIGRQLRS